MSTARIRAHVFCLDYVHHFYHLFWLTCLRSSVSFSHEHAIADLEFCCDGHLQFCDYEHVRSDLPCS